MTHERYRGGSKQSWILIFTFISLNSFILYLVIQDDLFLDVALASAALLTILFSKKIIITQTQKQDEPDILSKPHSGSVIDGYKILLKYFKISKKYLIASSTGLILALLVLSQLAITSTSFTQSGFNQYLEGNDLSVLTIEVTNVDNTTFRNWESGIEEVLIDMLNRKGFDYNSSWSYGELTFKIILGVRSNLDIGEIWVDFLRTTTKEWNEHIYDLYSQLPSFPEFEYNQVQSLLVIPPSLVFARSDIGTVHYQLNDFIDFDEYNNSYSIIVDESEKQLTYQEIINPALIEPFSNITTNFGYAWQLTEDDLVFMKTNKLILPFDGDQGYYYVTDDVEWDLFNSLQASVISSDENEYIWGDIGFASNVRVNLPLIKDFPLLEFNKRIDSFKNEIAVLVNEFIITQQPNMPSETITSLVRSPLGILTNNFLTGISDLNQIKLIISFPLLLVSLLLLYFSLTLISELKDKLFRQYLVKGGSIFQIRMMLFAEVLLSSILAVIIGMGLSIYTSSIFLKSSGFFQFNNTDIELMIPSNWYWRLPLLGILLSLDFQLLNLKNISKLELDHTSIDFFEGEMFWNKLHLDSLFFMAGTIYWLMVYSGYFAQNLEKIIFEQIGAIMLLFLIVGFPLIFGRYLLSVLSIVIKFLNPRFDTLNLAVNNLRAHKKFSNQLVCLLIACIMFSVMGIVITNTMIEVSGDRAKYTLGSEIYIEGIEITNTSQIDLLRIQGISSISPIKQLNNKPASYEIPPDVDYVDVITNHFLGVDPLNFAKSAYWDKTYASIDLESLMNSLDREGSTLMQKDYANLLDIQIGDNYSINFGFGGMHNYELKLTGVVNYFPRLITNIPSRAEKLENQRDLYFIVSLATFEKLQQQVSYNELTQGMYISLDEGVNIDDVTTELNYIFRNNPKVEIFSYSDHSVSLLKSINENIELAEMENDYLLISLNIILVMTSIVMIIGILAYLVVLLNSRSHEFGIYRALGMTRNQITKLLLYEIFLMLILGIFVGTFAGLILSNITFIVITGGPVNTLPPFSMRYPVSTLGISIIFLISISSILSFLYSYRISKRKYVNILGAL